MFTSYVFEKNEVSINLEILSSYNFHCRYSRKTFFQTVWSQRIVVFYFIAAMAAIRFGGIFERCREEQVNCVQTFMVSTLSSLALDSTKIFRILTGIGSLIILNYWLRRKTLDFANRTSSLRIISALSWPVLVCISLHWICELMSSEMDQFSLRTAQLVYVYFIMTVFYSIIFIRRKEFFQVLFHSATLVTAMILGDGLTPNVFALIFVNDFAAFTFDG